MVDPKMQRGSGGSSKRVLQRGGANLKADRLSHQLTRPQCRLLLQGGAAAIAHGTPFNRFITIAWGKCGMAPEDCVKATGEWITLYRTWLRSLGHPYAWLWVQEWGPRHGAHCHALLYVPPELDPIFRARPTKWARTVLSQRGLPYAVKTVQTQKLWNPPPLDALLRAWVAPSAPRSIPRPKPDHILPPPHLASARIDVLAYLTDLMGKLHYMLKCAPERLEDDLDMTRRGPKPWGEKCPVRGKRLATWQFRRKRKG